jgi:hypothetical protein
MPTVSLSRWPGRIVGLSFAETVARCINILIGADALALSRRFQVRGGAKSRPQGFLFTAHAKFDKRVDTVMDGNFFDMDAGISS